MNYYSDGRGEEAEFHLISRGVEVVPELAGRVVDLERLGKLLAIEAFETVGDPRACSPLIALLRDDDTTVVEWSARALGNLSCREAVVPLLPWLSESRPPGDVVPWWILLFVSSAVSNSGALPLREPTPQHVFVATSSAATWIYASTDGGRHWRTNLFLGDGGKGWSDFGFTTATQGVAIEGRPANGSHLYLTRNAGASWHKVRF